MKALCVYMFCQAMALLCRVVSAPGCSCVPCNLKDLSAFLPSSFWTLAVYALLLRGSWHFQISEHTGGFKLTVEERGKIKKGGWGGGDQSLKTHSYSIMFFKIWKHECLLEFAETRLDSCLLEEELTALLFCQLGTAKANAEVCPWGW